MKAARFYDRNDIRIEDIPAPEAAAGEVLGVYPLNLYGPTEAAVDVTFWETSADPQRESVPLIQELHARGDAVRRGVELCGPDDTVIVTGKGHEPFLEMAGEFIRYNDAPVMAEAVEEKWGRA